MVEFRVEKKDFITHLQRIFLGGLTFDCIFQVGKDTLKVEGFDLSKVIFFRVTSLAKTLTEGELLVGDISKLEQIISRFQGQLAISSDEVTMTIQEGRKRGKFVLPEKSTIDSVQGLDCAAKGIFHTTRKFQDIQYGQNFVVLESDFANDLVSDAKVLDYHRYELILDPDPKSSKVKIETKGNSWVINLGGCEQQVKKRSSVICSFGLKNILEAADDILILFIEEDAPLWIESLSGDSFYLLQVEDVK